MDHRRLAGRFNARLGRATGTRLIGGADEPLYQPGSGRHPAVIRYARDHAQSVLHELAHWCLAGPTRRCLVDYGLAYDPPPRSPARQARFFRAEVPVQALELLFARACGLPFHFSVDDPAAPRDDGVCRFEARVVRAHQALLRHGPNADAVMVLDAMAPDWRARVRPWRAAS
ncbi:MAG: elongation factor P hydroxylase [Pseudomonadales bacterium]